jgi:hypothetical protein
MNAAEGRKKRQGSTLLERVKRDPERAAHIDMLVRAAAVEQGVVIPIADALFEEHSHDLGAEHGD